MFVRRRLVSEIVDCAGKRERRKVAHVGCCLLVDQRRIDVGGTLFVFSSFFLLFLPSC